MTNQALNESLSFTRCSNWNTEVCPHMKDPHMQLTVINHPNGVMLYDQPVDIMAEKYSACLEFRHG